MQSLYGKLVEMAEVKISRRRLHRSLSLPHRYDRFDVGPEWMSEAAALLPGPRKQGPLLVTWKGLDLIRGHAGC
jgi:hypothetical protein